MSSSAPTITAADRGFTWSDEETSILLQLWSNVLAQTNVSNNNKKNISIFERVSEGMNNMGFLRTTSQCKEKIKRMKREYTVTKQKKQSGRNKKAMRFFELFEQILQTIQLKNSECAAEKSNCPDKEFVVKNKNSNYKKTNLKNGTPQLPPRNLRKRKQPVEVEDIPNPWSPDVVIIEDEIQPSPSTSKSESSRSRNSLGEPAKKKQALDNSCSSLSYFKTVTNSLSLKFMKYQTESEEKMLRELEELENEKVAMDERIQKMWVDFEERRKTDEGEHELKLMSALQGIINPKNLET